MTFREELSNRVRAWREENRALTCPRLVREKIERALREEWGPGKGGLASLTPEARREISSRGGLAASASGRAHRWTSEEARAAGTIGGTTAQTRGTTHRWTPDAAKAAGETAMRRRWVYGLGEGESPPVDGARQFELKREAVEALRSGETLWRSAAGETAWVPVSM